MSDIVEVTTTVETLDQAQSLADALVSQRLAACVQITGPIWSVYHWQQKIERSQEYRCTVKTTAAQADAAIAAIESSHPYDVPEILLTPVARSSLPYTAWLKAQVDDQAGPHEA